MNRMLSIDYEGARFGTRAVAVIFDREGERVLIHRAAHEDFWALPGGRIELGESSAEAVVREVQEEMGAEISVVRLLWVSEEFFTFVNVAWHGIAFYYLAHLPDDSPFYDQDEWQGIEEFVEDLLVPEEMRAETNRLQLIFRWYPIDRLDDLNIHPRFLRDRLRRIEPGVGHIIRHGDVEADL